MRDRPLPPLFSVSVVLASIGAIFAVSQNPHPFWTQDTLWWVLAHAYLPPAVFWGLYGAWRTRRNYFPFRDDPDRFQRMLGWLLGICLLPIYGVLYGIVVGGLYEFFRYMQKSLR